MRLFLLPLLLMLYAVPCAAAEDAVEIDLDHLYDEAAEEGVSVVITDEGPSLDLGSGLVSDRRSLAGLLSDYSAVTFIDAERFGAARSLGRILEQVSGADVRSQGGNGQLSTLMLRGAASGQVLVLLDGQPLSPQQASDLSLVSPWDLERIEVLRGPQALQFGAGAMGGVVNLVSLPAPRAGPVLPAYAEIGLPFKEYFAELCRMEFEQELELEADYPRYAVLAGSHGLAGFRLGHAQPGSSWQFSLQHADNDYSFTRSDGSRAVRQNAQSSQLAMRHAWMDDGIDYRLELASMQRGLPGSSEFPTLEAGMDRQNIWLQGANEERRTALSFQHTHVRDPLPYLNRGVIDTRDSLLHLEHEQRTDNSLWRPRLDLAGGDTADGRLRGGLDYSGWREDLHGDWSMLLGWGFTGSSDMGVDPMGSLAVKQEIDQHSSAYASLSRAVRHPAFEELYLSDSGSVRGNPNLEPEIADNLELGYGRSFSRARLDCAAFYTIYRDSIIFAPVSAYLVEARNTGQAEIAGAEASLDWQLDRRLWWTSSGTWLPHAEYASGTPLTGRSGLHASSSLQYSQADWGAAAVIDHSSSIPVDLFGNLRTSPRSIMDLELELRSGNGELSLALHNIFDSDARDIWNYPLPGRELIIMWSSEL